ncbi:unnamed protein product [Lathyrus sativus]|nr:unnamed protein product [Lathyrus sativus]
MEYFRCYRSWMYDKTLPGRRGLTPNFEKGVKGFITLAFAQECCRREGRVRCPCLKCECRPIISDLEEVERQECCRREGGVRCPCLKCECRPIISDSEEVERHLKRKGFIKNDWVWTYNGEQLSSNVHAEISNTHTSSSRSHMEFEE